MEAPEAYKMAAMMNIVSGAFNIIVGLLYLMFCVGIIPLGIGIFQVMVWMKMKDGLPHPQAKNSLIAGIVGGLFTLNLLSAAVAAFGFMNITKPESVAFLEG